MAHLVFTDAFVSINGVDLSDDVESVQLEYKSELQDDTNMGHTTRKRLGGLKDWSLQVNFRQDFAAAQVDATLFSLVGSTFTVIVRPVKGTVVGATNPNYTGTGILESYRPIGDGVGSVATAPVTIQAAGDLSRAVA
jgi:hypothetical protein